MKKFLVIAGLALAVAALLEHQAWAWRNSSFSFGLNWTHSCGGNNFLWGLYRNGQPGEPDMPNWPKHYYAVQHGYGYGNQPFGHGLDGQFLPPAPPAPFSAPAPTPVPGPQAYWYGQPAYQAVNYAPEFSGNYYMPVNWYGR